MDNSKKIMAKVMAIPEPIKLLRRIKERLDKLMSDPVTPIEIRSTDLYLCVARDRDLKVAFPDAKTFNQFLRRQCKDGTLKQIISNCRVDKSNPNFYKWYFFREPYKSSGPGKGVITIENKFKGFRNHLNKISSSGLKLRSEQEREIYEKLLQCDFLKIEYEAPIYKYGEKKFVDFKISNITNDKIYFWEHFGMVGSDRYLNAMPEKIKWYNENGFRLIKDGGNLIYTIFYDHHSFHKDIDRCINLITQ